MLFPLGGAIHQHRSLGSFWLEPFASYVQLLTLPTCLGATDKSSGGSRQQQVEAG